MDDAYGCSLPRAGMPPKYYEGYYYACALNYEDIGRPVCTIAEDEPAGDAPSVRMPADEASLAVQLLRLQAELSLYKSQPGLDRQVAVGVGAMPVSGPKALAGALDADLRHAAVPNLDGAPQDAPEGFGG